MLQAVDVLVYLLDDIGLLDREVGGRPVGRYLIDALRRCDGIDIRIVRAGGGALPDWCEGLASLTPDVAATGLREDACTLLIDGRAWLPDRVLAGMLDGIRLGAEDLLLKTWSGSSGGDASDTLALGLLRGRRRSVLVDAAVRAARDGFAGLHAVIDGFDARPVDAGRLGSRTPPVLVHWYESLAEVERYVLLERAGELMRRGVRVRDPRRFYLRGELSCGTGVEIDVDVIVEGTVCLGDHVVVGAHSILRDARIGSGTAIHPFTLIERSTVGSDGFVGPYSRVRPGCDIGDHVQIGNYVELKNARIGGGSRINHHAFVGDADLGDAVTIGAGTITCNHDGISSTHTTIGRGAYIGSSCNLVAPIHIGERATIGAGSTVTSDVPAETLTLARARQTSIDHWSGPKKR